MNIKDKIKEKANNIEYNKDIVDVLNWKYEYIDSVSIPTKTSVTKLKELEHENIVAKILETKQDNSNEEKLKNGKQKMTVLNYLSNEGENEESLKLEDRPKFLMGEEKITGSKRGTLMHLCMQKMKENKEYSVEDIKALVFELVQKEIILPNEAEAININQLLEYTKSDLWKELKDAKEIHKEEPFYLNVSAKEVFESSVDDFILVQGIIDLFFINKNDELILIDYKTDYIKPGEEKVLIEKYKKQLELYKRALESGLKRKVNKMYIYSTVLNKNIDI
jgi:ATP-dependent helicase/nuclease subunit A